MCCFVEYIDIHANSGLWNTFIATKWASVFWSSGVLWTVWQQQVTFSVLWFWAAETLSLAISELRFFVACLLWSIVEDLDRHEWVSMFCKSGLLWTTLKAMNGFQCFVIVVGCGTAWQAQVSCSVLHFYCASNIFEWILMFIPVATDHGVLMFKWVLMFIPVTTGRATTLQAHCTAVDAITVLLVMMMIGDDHNDVSDARQESKQKFVAWSLVEWCMSNVEWFRRLAGICFSEYRQICTYMSFWLGRVYNAWCASESDNTMPVNPTCHRPCLPKNMGLQTVSHPSTWDVSLWMLADRL